MWSRRGESVRRALRRWLLPAAVAALAPKCLVCVLAYFGLGTALGLNSPELCGGSDGLSAAWATPVLWLGIAGALAYLGLRARCRCMWRTCHQRPRGGINVTES